jgi:hypothetical protein
MGNIEFVLLGMAMFAHMAYRWKHACHGFPYFPAFLLLCAFLMYETPDLPPFEKEGYPTAPIVRFR